MGILFWKKKKGVDENSSEEQESEESSEESSENEEDGSNKPSNQNPANNEGGENISLGSLVAEVEKLKASFESFGEIRKSFSDRFTRTSEQIGELRSMINEKDKTIQEVELKAIKSYDLVSTVQPEKMMTLIQKSDARIEALKANLEGNESIMARIMDELKETKKKVEFIRGVEEIIKLSEETKKDLLEIKKVESRIALNTDKVDTIYSEMSKRFQKFDLFDSTLQEIKAQSEQNRNDIQNLKDKVINLASKEDVDKVINKVQKYVDALKDLEKKSSMTKDIERLKEILSELK